MVWILPPHLWHSESMRHNQMDLHAMLHHTTPPVGQTPSSMAVCWLFADDILRLTGKLSTKQMILIVVGKLVYNCG